MLQSDYSMHTKVILSIKNDTWIISGWREVWGCLINVVEKNGAVAIARRFLVCDVVMKVKPTAFARSGFYEVRAQENTFRAGDKLCLKETKYCDRNVILNSLWI